MAESSTKPYLIRALYEWCCDNGYTPYLAVVVDRHTLVPRQHVRNGEIVLNVSPMATNHMAMGNDLIEFQARFSGVAQQLSIPVENVAAVYARETGHGMAFEVARPAPAAENADDATDDATMPSVTAGTDPAAPAETEGVREAGSPAADLRPATRTPAGSRKRVGKAQGSADVIAFASSGGGRKKAEPAGRSGSAQRSGASARHPASPGDELPAGEGADAATARGGKPSNQDAGEGATPANGADASAHPPDDHDEPPPSGGGKGGRTRLTRVK